MIPLRGIGQRCVFLVLALIAISIACLPVETSSPVVIVAAGLMIGLALSGTANRFLTALFLLLFAAQVAFSLVVYNMVFVQRGTGLLGDGWSYSESGYSILTMWCGGMRNIDAITEHMMKISTSGNLGSYDFWNAIVYYFTGKSPLSLIFINCLASSLAVIVIYHIAKELYNERAARIAALLTAFWPSLFMWSIQNLKEPLSIFLTALLVWVLLKLKSHFRFYLLVLALLASYALKELRLISFLAFYAIILPLSLILTLWKKHKLFFITLVFVAGACLVIAIQNHLHHGSLLGFLHYARSTRAYGNTAFLSSFDISSPGKFTVFAPIALVFAWLAPFPWQIANMSQISAIPEMIVYYLLLPSMFAGWGYIIKHKIREGGIIVVYIFVMMLVLAFLEGNIGTLFRHRAMVLPFMFILIGIGVERSTAKKISKVRPV